MTGSKTTDTNPFICHEISPHALVIGYTSMHTVEVFSLSSAGFFKRCTLDLTQTVSASINLQGLFEETIKKGLETCVKLGWAWGFISEKGDFTTP